MVLAGDLVPAGTTLVAPDLKVDLLSDMLTFCFFYLVLHLEII